MMTDKVRDPGIFRYLISLTSPVLDILHCLHLIHVAMQKSCHIDHRRYILFSESKARSIGFLEFTICSLSSPECVLLRKEVIQPHLPIRLPCYDFTPIICPTFGSALLAVMLLTSGVANSHGVTGGVYKARERIHGSMLTCHY